MTDIQFAQDGLARMPHGNRQDRERGKGSYRQGNDEQTRCCLHENQS
jgi:hypothetical protein